MDEIDTQDSAIARISRSEDRKAKLQEHLQQIVEGSAFKGSQRSGQFLRYIVDQALRGQYELLKERMIGVALFGRIPTYDTGEDAIVRVTASDVRKRLLQHYGKYGFTSPFRISLPLGTYIPEITLHEDQVDTTAPQATNLETTEELRHAESLPPQTAAPLPPSETRAPLTPSTNRLFRFWLLPGFAAVLLLVATYSFLLRPHATASTGLIEPWELFFNSDHRIAVVTSDPDIAEIQNLTGVPVSVSDYANHRYIPSSGRATPEEERLCRTVLRGDKSASVDMPVAVNIGQLAGTHGRNVSVSAAREFQLTNLKTDDNFIFLGSPLSNPWVTIFSDQLDFRFVFDPKAGSEYIRNERPRSNEKPSYVPVTYTPTPSGPIKGTRDVTGDSYAIMALVQNPDQEGSVLLLGGINREGTEAVGKLATDIPRLTAILHNCGIGSSSTPQHFEMLLHFDTMAGSSSHVNVVACHLLPNASGARH